MTKQPIRVLIVEDCPEDRETFTRFLNQNVLHRYVVFEADTGRQGCELIAQEQPHCVLLDYRLPDLNGLQVLCHLGEVLDSQEMPAVVMLTNHGSEALAAAAWRSGALDYLSKATLTGEQLRGSVRRAVAQVKDFRRRKRKEAKTQRELKDTIDKIHAAGEIQRMMLPRTQPQVAGFDIGAGCLPAEATGGDFFDFIMMPDGRLGLVMGDVVGHGLGPALFASETRAYLRAFSRTMSDPGAILVATNQLLYEDTEGERFVTLFFGILDPLSRSLCFSGAGHRAFLLQADGEVTRIDSHQPPLGLSPDFIRNTQREMPLRPNDLFFLMTDGITESACPENGLPLPERMFGEARALEFLQNNRCKPAGVLVSELFQRVHRYTEQSIHDDDMTVMIVKVLPEGGLTKKGTGSPVFTASDRLPPDTSGTRIW
jgi:phosphoserine phosphatase RsbU/P